MDVHRYYSYSACCVQCRKEAQLQKCGCTHHLMPNTTSEQQCEYEGLQCLDEKYHQIAVLKASWSSRNGLVCGCLPSCTEIELSVIRDDKTGTVHEYATVELSLEKLPTEMFKRKVVRGKLDLVVSMGGAISLFLGASILSFVEVIYYFFIRPFSDISREKLKKRKKPVSFGKIKFQKNNLMLARVS
nr:pickpocket protein 11-like [Leptinotarsa decemlineata]